MALVMYKRAKISTNNMRVPFPPNLRSIHRALASLIMLTVDAKIYNEDVYIMYTDFKGVFDATDHRIMFKHM
jgi:hypothetical protein